MDTGKIIRLHLVVMPRFHHTRVCGGEIDLTELVKNFIVAPHNFHQPPALIGKNLELFQIYPFDGHIHGRFPHSEYREMRKMIKVMGDVDFVKIRNHEN